jgi:hypothetical protein
MCTGFGHSSFGRLKNLFVALGNTFPITLPLRRQLRVRVSFRTPVLIFRTLKLAFVVSGTGELCQ